MSIRSDHQRYTGQLSRILKLSDFPMDEYSFNVHFVAAGHPADELEFLPDTALGIVGGSMAKDLSLPDWEILQSEALSLPFTTLLGHASPGFAFRFEARRYFIYYLWQVVLPLAVVVSMSLAAFWVPQKDVGVRIGVATSSILTLKAHTFCVGQSVAKKLPYMTRMAYFTVGSTLLVFLALISVVGSANFYVRAEKKQTAHRIDKSAKRILPSVFLT